MVDRLFFDELITITLEGFMELCISGYLEHINPWRNYTEIFSVYVGYICLFLALITLPSVLIWVLIQDRETFDEPQFEDKYGRAY